MNIDTIKRETKKATQLQIRGKTIEAMRLALGSVKMALELKTAIKVSVAQEAFYRLNMCWYALMASSNEKWRDEATKIKHDALVLIGEA